MVETRMTHLLKVERERDEYKKRWEACLDAIEFTLSSEGCEDWLREWVSGDAVAFSLLDKWIEEGRPE